MERYATLLFISAFTISAVSHLFLHCKIAQCREPRYQSFYSGWFAAGWPYAVACGLIKYGLPKLLLWVGFGPLGILPRSIAAWIQSVYGVSTIFSFLQSIGARGGVSHPVIKSIGLGTLFQTFKGWLRGDDHVAQCVSYYESRLTILNMMDLVIVVGWAVYWLLACRR